MKTTAILMAAGMGTRMRPITDIIPKPLVKIHNKPMIETVIEAVKKYPVEEIYVIVGYLREQFEYLNGKYDKIYLIDNNDFEVKNNISSIYAARNYLGKTNTFICESDIYILDDSIFEEKLQKSCYFGRMQSGFSDDWVFELENGIISRIGRGGTNTYNMVGIAYFTQKDAMILKDCIIREYNNGSNNLFWDDVVNNNIDKFNLSIKEVYDGQLVEIDTIEELKIVNESL